MTPLKRFLAAVALASSAALAPQQAWAAPDENFDSRPQKPLATPQAQVPPVAGRALVLDDRLWIVAEAPERQQRTAVANTGISIEEVKGSHVGGIGFPEMAEALRAAGIRFTAVPLGERFRPEDFPQKDSIYHNYAELTAELQELAANGRGLVSLFSIGKSLQGDKDLWAVRLNPTESGLEPSAKPGIVFLGNHHAREHLSAEIPLMLAKHLADNREKPEIARLLASRDIYIIPMVNPDGVEYDIRPAGPGRPGVYHMHRKNLRDNGDGSVGVDLNRNYSFQWGKGGASPNTRSETYRGPAAFSEPETRAVRDFVEARKNLRILLSYHTFSELILYPWGHSDDPIPETPALEAYRAMAETMGAMTGYTPQQSSQLYIASGDTTDWAWGTHKIFSFTFELTPKSMQGGGFYPGARAVQSTFQNNLRPALYLIDLADDPYRAKKNVSTLTQAPSPATHATGGL